MCVRAMIFLRTRSPPPSLPTSFVLPPCPPPCPLHTTLSQPILGYLDACIAQGKRVSEKDHLLAGEARVEEAGGSRKRKGEQPKTIKIMVCCKVWQCVTEWCSAL